MSSENINMHAAIIRDALPDLKKLVKELNYLTQISDHGCSKLKPEENTRLNQVATLLSPLLPKVSDTTIFEIDDIIYGDDDDDVVAGTNLTSEENISYLVENCFKPICNVFTGMQNDCSRIVEMVFLQLLELAPTNIFHKWERSTCSRNTVLILRKFQCIGLEERYLKIMKIVARKVGYYVSDIGIDFEDFLPDHFKKFIASLRLHYFTKNTDFGNIQEKRRALWISEQSEIIFKKSNFTNFEELEKCEELIKKYFETCQIENEVRYDWIFIGLLMYCKDKHGKFNADFCNNHLNNYFSSARDNEEKMQRIQDFIRGTCKSALFQTWGMTRNEEECLFDFTKYSTPIVKGIFQLFRDIDKYSSLSMIKLQRHHEYDIGPYLSKDNYCSAYMTFKEETEELVKKYFGILNYSDGDHSDASEEFFCDGEKISFYHKFMKGLQLMEIIHATWMMLEGHKMLKKILPRFVTQIFRPNNSPIKIRINEFITDPSKRGRVDWWIPFLLMKCPFLIQSYQCESHMKNLIKLLKGINIDKDTEATLHMITNDKRHYKKIVWTKTFRSNYAYCDSDFEEDTDDDDNYSDDSDYDYDAYSDYYFKDDDDDEAQTMI